ncbi:hypothetical protein RLDS_04275 [Sphingobium lactosutens DS20]|uniref:Uncharacterized protein n=1 Tax=Sphingobium lactosutens DS20 TaxID=1331060 RepID=T0IZ60_9SPHN|nr:hypothetical protein RLDS_04275 [Sphingobium lactosutens DS20]
MARPFGADPRPNKFVPVIHECGDVGSRLAGDQFEHKLIGLHLRPQFPSLYSLSDQLAEALARRGAMLVDLIADTPRTCPIFAAGGVDEAATWQGALLNEAEPTIHESQQSLQGACARRAAP